MTIYAECQVCAKVVEFDNMMDYHKALEGCGAEFECEEHRGGPEDD